jgi:hypothetical protein
VTTDAFSLIMAELASIDDRLEQLSRLEGGRPRRRKNSPTASLAGQQDTYLNVVDRVILEHVSRSRASLCDAVGRLPRIAPQSNHMAGWNISTTFRHSP